MQLSIFIEKVTRNLAINFEDTMAVISENYSYTPTQFFNGLNDERLVNEKGTNEGSCKIFAFAQIHQFSQQQTLNLFGDFYRVDVLKNPDGVNHQNIRNFMRFGWAGIAFNGQPLIAKIAQATNELY